MGRHELSDSDPVTPPADPAKVIEIKVVVTAAVA